MPQRFICLLYLCFITLVIFLSDFGTCGALCAPAKSLFWGDKLGHFILIGLLTAAVYFGLSSRELQFACWRISLAAGCVFCFITLEEFSQLWIPARTADIADLLASYSGIVCFELWRQRRAKQVSV